MKITLGKYDLWIMWLASLIMIVPALLVVCPIWAVVEIVGIISIMVWETLEKSFKKEEE
jgi:hypothetical protein